jgi:hypothetical protein
VLLASNCSPTTDIVAYERLQLDAGAMQRDAQAAELTVIGMRATGWPFAFAPWPLAEGLEDFFSSPPDDREVRVVVSGPEAQALRDLALEYDADEYGPQGGPLGVRDDLDAEYTIRLLP